MNSLMYIYSPLTVTNRVGKKQQKTEKTEKTPIKNYNFTTNKTHFLYLGQLLYNLHDQIYCNNFTLYYIAVKYCKLFTS